jgi:hypothetical protein
MSDVWDSFNRQLEVGDGIGRQIRNQRAYNDGGLSAVEEAAGQAGDMAGMEDTREMQRRQRRFQDDERNRAYERMETLAPWARNVLRATRNQDPARARAFLERPDIRQRFIDFGFDEQQVASGIEGLTSADPAIRQQWVEQLDAAFRQHEDPNWQIMNSETGQIGGIDPASGQYVEGGRAPAGVGREWRLATPEELQAAGAPPGTIMDINVQNGERRVRRNPPAGRSAAGGGQYEDDGYDYEGG